MNKILLFTNPAHDIPAQYFEAWSQEIVDRAKRNTSIHVIELKGSSVTRDTFIKLLETQKPRLVILNGHGDENAITGFESNILIRYGKDETLLQGKIVHALACESGKKIAPECIRLGTLVFIGYKNKFLGAYNRDAKTPEEMSRDAYAELIMEPAFEAASALIDGKSAQEAYLSSQQKYSKNLSMLLAGPQTFASTEIARRIYENFKNQVCLGNTSTLF